MHRSGYMETPNLSFIDGDLRPIYWEIGSSTRVDDACLLQYTVMKSREKGKRGSRAPRKLPESIRGSSWGYFSLFFNKFLNSFWGPY